MKHANKFKTEPLNYLYSSNVPITLILECLKNNSITLTKLFLFVLN